MTVPYHSTRKPYQESRAEIEELLKVYGVSESRWIEESKRLAVIFSLSSRGKTRLVCLSPPLLVNSNNYILWDPTYRLLYWSLKPRLEAVCNGGDIDQEFLADIVIKRSALEGMIRVGDQFSLDRINGKVQIVTNRQDNALSLPVNALVEVDKTSIHLHYSKQQPK